MGLLLVRNIHFISTENHRPRSALPLIFNPEQEGAKKAKELIDDALELAQGTYTRLASYKEPIRCLLDLMDRGPPGTTEDSLPEVPISLVAMRKPLTALAYLYHGECKEAFSELSDNVRVRFLLLSGLPSLIERMYEGGKGRKAETAIRRETET